MNTKGLGRYQREVLEHLKQGFHISVHCDYSRMEEDAELSDEDKANTISLPHHKRLISAFLRRGIISYVSVYRTTMPDTESFVGLLNHSGSSWEKVKTENDGL